MTWQTLFFYAQVFFWLVLIAWLIIGHVRRSSVFTRLYCLLNGHLPRCTIVDNVMRFTCETCKREVEPE